MKLYVLDTDLCGFAQQEHPKVLQRFQQLAEDDEVVTTIVTFGEDLSGWLPARRRATGGSARVRAYDRLQLGLDFYRDKDCLPFDEVAAALFDRFRAHRIRIGTNDLAIAAITFSVGGILVTRNIIAFQKIPDLVLEDWTT